MNYTTCLKRTCALVLALVCLDAFGGEITIYYLRHAEGGHNAPEIFKRKGIPTNEWPSWVGNPNVFTPDGSQQVAAVAGKLGTNRFDLIAVSPLWRTRNTILPYLKEQGRTAVIWPELMEISPKFVKDESDPARFIVSSNLWTGLRDIKLPPEEKEWFTFRDDPVGKRELKLQNCADAYAFAERVETMIREKAGTNDFKVLLVGHAVAGAVLIRHLLGDMDFGRGLNNACLWAAREKPDGTFELYRLNDEPYAPRPRKAKSASTPEKTAP